MKLTRHLAGYLPVNLASAIAAFGGVFVFTRLLSPDEYGRYALCLSLMALLHTLTLTWVEAAGFRFHARAAAQGRLPDHFRTGIALIWRSLLLAILVWAVVYLFLRGVPGYARILPWIAVLMPLATILKFALEAHRAGQDVGRFARVQTAQILLGFTLGALLAWQTGLGAAAPFAGLAVAAGLLAVRESAFVFHSARGGKVDGEFKRQWAGYGWPIAAALALDLLLSAADRFLIAAFLGEGAVGAYAAGYGVADKTVLLICAWAEGAVGAYAAGYGVADKTVLLICAWAAMAGAPLIMAAYETRGPDGAAREARGLIRTLLLFGMPAASGLALVADPLSRAMIGEDLREAARPIIPWIAFAGLLNGLLIHYASEAFQLARRTGLRAALMTVPAGLNIVLNLLLLPALGVMGAVYATVLSYAAGVGLLALVGRSLVALPWPARDAMKTALACLAMWPVIALIPSMPAWPELFAKALAGGASFAIAAFALDAGGARGFLNSLSGRSASHRDA
ncbi:MAG: oligosaccharide flippase family protein [Alphaproteobacteria bacterium]|jgi:O-antigen/teichoic acid export membrane protein|nr:oligosaccharide flippase family protein [Alphaproteobacteria bacterium]